MYEWKTKWRTEWKTGMKRGIKGALAVTLIFVLVPLTRPTGRQAEAGGRIVAADSPSLDVVSEWDLLRARLTEAAWNGTGENVDFLAGDSFELSQDILGRLAGKNVTLAMQTGKGVAFSVSGPEVRRTDRPVRISVYYDLAIPARVKNRIPDEDVILRLGMEEKEAYPCRVNMHLSLGASNAGSYVVLFSYDEEKGAMRQEDSFQIDGAGQAMFRLARGDEYLVGIFCGYLAEPGDSLARIAAREGISLRDLMATNQQIEDFDLIRPGQLIYLPTL